jgi:hypothetical protein
MNPEARKIVQDLETLTKTAKATEAESQSWSRFIAWRTAALQVILAEEAEKQAAKLTYFTWVLVAFTIALVVIAISQMVVSLWIR